MAKSGAYVGQMSMVESLGLLSPCHSLDELDSEEKRKALGSVYTPKFLGDWLAITLISLLDRSKKVKVVDPACGDGALLLALATAAHCSGIAVELTGLDVDKFALNNLTDRVKAETIHCDAIMSCSFDGQFDGLIANPPWGANVGCSPQELRALGFSLAKGQFDSYDLFLEMGMRMVKPGGALAWIVPDSIFSEQHASTRKLIASSSQIEMIGRLGEGIFDGVFRGTAVVILVNQKPKENHEIRCFRLGSRQREAISKGTSSLSEFAADFILVPQDRFLKSNSDSWETDIEESDVSCISKIRSLGGDWTAGLIGGRGVELSKNGRIVQCQNCHFGVALPKTELQYCENCGVSFSQVVPLARSVISAIGNCSRNTAPFLVGEDVDRHRATPSRRIELGINGINYKRDQDFSERKLLVRKTGVGLKAAVDNSGSITNQVVYHYRIDDEGDRPDWYLDFLEGVLCSRIMYAYYLKSHGETEWRSHPYITQSTLARLPIPMIGSMGPIWKRAREIANATIRLRARMTLEEELAVENLVAGLYRLTNDECDWALGVIAAAQPLEPVRSLRLPSAMTVRPLVI